VAELSALLHMDGVYAIRGQTGHALATESSGVYTARKIYTLIHALFELDTSLVKVTRRSPRRGAIYRLELPDQPGFQQALHEIGILGTGLSPELVVPRRLTKNDCCAASALRGAFLGGGYVSEPYGPADLEIQFSTREAAASLEKLFRRRGFEPGNRRRRGQSVLYLKRRKQISNFLAITGAHSAHLEWESRTIMNATRNSVNRKVNCDAANARRLSVASSRQRETCAALSATKMLDDASPELREIAELRMKYPHASLAELARLADPQVSKAVVQGRMRKLESLIDP